MIVDVINGRSFSSCEEYIQNVRQLVIQWKVKQKKSESNAVKRALFLKL